MTSHFLLQCMNVKRESEVAQLCLTLSDPMACSLPGSSIHGILQASVLEWGAIAFSKKVNDESEKVGLKLSIQKTKIMASSPITSWQIDGETVETVSDFILGAPKSLQMVTAAMKLKDAYSLEGKL